MNRVLKEKRGLVAGGRSGGGVVVSDEGEVRGNNEGDKGNLAQINLIMTERSLSVLVSPF